jgi:hypothetical protein
MFEAVCLGRLELLVAFCKMCEYCTRRRLVLRVEFRGYAEIRRRKYRQKTDGLEDLDRLTRVCKSDKVK